MLRSMAVMHVDGQDRHHFATNGARSLLWTLYGGTVWAVTSWGFWALEYLCMLGDKIHTNGMEIPSNFFQPWNLRRKCWRKKFQKYHPTWWFDDLRWYHPFKNTQKTNSNIPSFPQKNNFKKTAVLLYYSSSLPASWQPRHVVFLLVALLISKGRPRFEPGVCYIPWTPGHGCVSLGIPMDFRIGPWSS